MNILSLVDQLYQSKLVTSDSHKSGKMNFSKNLIVDLLAQGLKAFKKNITLYNKSVDWKKYRIRAANEKQAFDKKI